MFHGDGAKLGISLVGCLGEELLMKAIGIPRSSMRIKCLSNHSLALKPKSFLEQKEVWNQVAARPIDARSASRRSHPSPVLMSQLAIHHRPNSVHIDGLPAEHGMQTLWAKRHPLLCTNVQILDSKLILTSDNMSVNHLSDLRQVPKKRRTPGLLSHTSIGLRILRCQSCQVVEVATETQLHLVSGTAAMLCARLCAFLVKSV